MAFKLIIEGDDKDELITALDAAKEMLGGEAESSDDDDSGDDDSGDDDAGDDDSGDDDSGDGDDADEQREKIKKGIVKLSKTSEGANAIRAALTKFAGKGKKLGDVKDAKLPALAKALKIKL